MSFRESTLITLATFTLSASSHAMIGDFVTDGGPASVCVILPAEKGKTPGEPKILGLCSGTLVTSTEVRTAAHCLDGFIDGTFSKDARIGVGCGYLDSHGEVNFKEIRAVRKALIAQEYSPVIDGHDSATLVLSSPITAETIKPMPVLSASESPLSFIRTALDCKVSGYGDTYSKPSGNLKTGKISYFDFTYSNTLKRLDLSIAAQGSYHFDPNTRRFEMIPNSSPFVVGAKSLERLASAYPTKAGTNEYTRSIDDGAIFNAGGKDLKEFIQIMEMNFMFLTLIEHGDSGGPLYCRKDKDSPYTLVGINQGINTNINYTDTTQREMKSVSRLQVWSNPNLPMKLLKEFDLKPLSTSR